MNKHDDKTQQSKRRPVNTAGYLSQSKRGSDLQFDDNRPEAVTQNKLQDMVNDSPQVRQLKAVQETADNSPRVQQHDYNTRQKEHLIQKKENKTGLSDDLKTGMENLSGLSLDEVKVHRNSEKPARFQAHAYASGTDIHLGPGQDKHLPHEAWHVVQQMQGRVKPTVQLRGGVSVNDDANLEKEADIMSMKALSTNTSYITTGKNPPAVGNTLQLVLNYNQLKQKDSGANGIKQSLIYLLNEIIICPDPKEEMGEQRLAEWGELKDLGNRAVEIAKDPIKEGSKAALDAIWENMTPAEKAELIARLVLQGAKGFVTLLRNMRVSISGDSGIGGEAQPGGMNFDFSLKNLGNFEVNKDDLELLYNLLKARHDFNKEKERAEQQVEKGKSKISSMLDTGAKKLGKGQGSRKAEKYRNELYEVNLPLIEALDRNYAELKQELEDHENVGDRYDDLFDLFDFILGNKLLGPLGYLFRNKLSGDQRSQLKNKAALYLALLESTDINIPVKEQLMDLAGDTKKKIASGFSALRDKFK